VRVDGGTDAPIGRKVCREIATRVKKCERCEQALHTNRVILRLFGEERESTRNRAVAWAEGVHTMPPRRRKDVPGTRDDGHVRITHRTRR